MRPVRIRSAVSIVVMILASGCGTANKDIPPPIEISPIANVRLREAPTRIDVSRVKIIGNPTRSDLKEALQIIGRLEGYDMTRLGFIRFMSGPDVLEVDFAFGGDYFSMRKTGTKWEIYSRGGIEYCPPFISPNPPLREKV